MSVDTNKFFLPYQLDWLDDFSKIKIWEKGRREGATYVQSFEDVRDIIRKTEYIPGRPLRKVLYISLSEENAKEYVAYCGKWAEVLSRLIELKYSEEAFEEDDVGADGKRIKTKILTIEFPAGEKIKALSGNPERFRGEEGKVVFDEFGRKKDQYETWKAGQPCMMWGYPARIISTHGGKQTLFYRFIQDVKSGKRNWSLHSVPITEAVNQGLYDRIMNRPTSEEERAAWIAEIRRDCGDDDSFQEEYMCVAVDSTTAFLTYEEIAGAVDYDLLMDLDQLAELADGDLYGGYDIARMRDLIIFWVLQRIGNSKFTRHIKVFEKASFDEQRDYLNRLMNLPRMRRMCIDASGMGLVIAEDAENKYGLGRIEGVTFSGPVKEDLGFYAKSQLIDRQSKIPPDDQIRESFHSIVKTKTAAGHIRLDADRTDATGHADHFWAFTLALHAAKTNAGPLHIISHERPAASGPTAGYFNKRELRGFR